MDVGAPFMASRSDLLRFGVAEFVERLPCRRPDNGIGGNSSYRGSDQSFSLSENIPIIGVSIGSCPDFKNRRSADQRSWREAVKHDAADIFHCAHERPTAGTRAYMASYPGIFPFAERAHCNRRKLNIRGVLSHKPAPPHPLIPAPERLIEFMSYNEKTGCSDH